MLPRSSHAAKPSAGKVVASAVFAVAVITLLLLAVAAAVFISKYFFNNNLPLAACGLLLLFVFSVAAALFLRQRLRLKKWCAQNPEACRIVFPRNKLQATLIFRYMILSVDKVPLGKARNAFSSGSSLYLLPGEHLVEFLLVQTSWWHSRMHNFSENRRIEKQVVFKRRMLYSCEASGVQNKLRIVSKGFWK